MGRVGHPTVGVPHLRVRIVHLADVDEHHRQGHAQVHRHRGAQEVGGIPPLPVGQVAAASLASPPPELEDVRDLQTQDRPLEPLAGSKRRHLPIGLLACVLLLAVKIWLTHNMVQHHMLIFIFIFHMHIYILSCY